MPGDEEHGERTRAAEQGRARHRLDAPDAVAEPALNRDLHGARQAGAEGEHGSDSRRSHGTTLYAPRVAQPTHPTPRDPSELGLETIVYEKAPPRATIRLNRPDVLNAFDFRMLREIAVACEDASWDDDVRAVVVTGTGRAFCVGADLRTLG